MPDDVMFLPSRIIVGLSRQRPFTFQMRALTLLCPPEQEVQTRFLRHVYFYCRADTRKSQNISLGYIAADIKYAESRGFTLRLPETWSQKVKDIDVITPSADGRRVLSPSDTTACR